MLIRDINTTFSGRKSGHTRIEYERNILFTLQAALGLKRRRQAGQQTQIRNVSAMNWKDRLENETFTRLDYCIYRECARSMFVTSLTEFL